MWANKYNETTKVTKQQEQATEPVAKSAAVPGSKGHARDDTAKGRSSSKRIHKKKKRKRNKQHSRRTNKEGKGHIFMKNQEFDNEVFIFLKKWIF